MKRKGLGGWWFWAGLVLVTILVFAGCQPAGSEFQSPQVDDVETVVPSASSGQVPSASSGQAPSTSSGQAPSEREEGESGTAEGTYSVGFTEEGYPFKGDPNADVVIEEFSSYQCPFCSRYFAQTYPDIVSRYVETGQVKYVYRDFPLSGQPQSPKAAEAARCAGEVGGAQAYWDMHDQLFEKQQAWSGRSNAVEIFKGYAADFGLDQPAFDECLDSGRTAEKVQADQREGMTRGVRGTPSFFINGQVLAGAQPISAFAAVIDGALAGDTEGAAAADSGSSEAAADIVVPTPATFAFEQDGGGDTLLALGDPNAPVKLVEFTDYQCPFCYRYYKETWPQIKAQYVDTGRVYYVLKDFPLTSIHPQAFKAHEAARCASDVGGDDVYWAMHDLLFENQSEWAENPDYVELFKAYAAELELEEAAFNACLDSGQYADAVQAALSEGERLGVTGTPTFFVNGYPFSGAQPIQFFDQALALAENGQLRDAIAQAIARAQAEEERLENPDPPMVPADVPVGDAPMKGDPDAPVTIVEYSDYQCPFCERHFRETLSLIEENYIDTGKVRYVFKDFPLTSIHPQAFKAHEAARCAGELGGNDAYWRMHDRLFESQEEWGGNSKHVDVFNGYADELGLDQAAFDTCLDSGRYAEAVQSDLEEGVEFGVTGTPAFFINDQPVQGARPYQDFARIIDEMLGE